MSRNFNGSTQYLENTSLAETYPLTMACWFYVPTGSAGASLMNMGGDSDLHYHWLSANDATKLVQVSSRNGGSGASAVTTSTWSFDTWHHACAVIAGSSSRSAFLDGGNKGSDLNGRTPTINQFNIGVRFYNATYSQYHQGLIAHAAVWTTDLSDTEVALLASGVMPWEVDSANLAAYWELMGDFSPEPDWWENQYHLTLANSPTQGNHPPLVRQLPKQKFFPVMTPRASGALKFRDTNNTDQVNFGNSSSLNDITAGTLLMWVKMNSRIADMALTAKWSESGTGYRNLTVPAITSRYRFDINRATTDLYIISSNVLSAGTDGTWLFLGASWNTAGGSGDQKLYRGNLSTVVTEESAYTTRNVGSGSVYSDASHNMGVGNTGASSPSGAYAFDGDVAWVGVWNRQLSDAEIQAQQYNIIKPVGQANNVLFARLGQIGTGTQPDWSGQGNHGTVYGAEMIQGVPLPIQRSQPSWLEAVAALAALEVNISPDNLDSYAKGVKIYTP